MTGWRDECVRKRSLFPAATTDGVGGRREKKIIKGKKKSHYSRGIADFRSAQTPGDWITFFISLLRAEDITKLKTL